AARSRPHAGQVLLRIDRFGFTANNITYVTLGDRFSYWSFFPAADGWGRIPVWGFATVLESACDGIAAGERFFGYYPMSSHGVMEPTPLTPAGFAATIPNRPQRPRPSNRYLAATS